MSWYLRCMGQLLNCDGACSCSPMRGSHCSVQWAPQCRAASGMPFCCDDCMRVLKGQCRKQTDTHTHAHTRAATACLRA